VSKGKYQNLFYYAIDAFLIVDEDGNILEANKKAEDLLGYTCEELISMNITRIHPLEEIEQVFLDFKKGLERGLAYFSGGHVLRKDGKKVPVEVTGSIIEIDGERITLGIIKDASQQNLVQKELNKAFQELEHHIDERTAELREAYESLQKEMMEKIALQKAVNAADERFYLLSEHINAGVAIIQNEVLQYCNKRILELSGYSMQELINRRFLECIHTEDCAMVLEEYEKTIQGKVSGHLFKARLIDKAKKEIWWEWYMMNITWEGKKGVLCLIRGVMEKIRE
jgi:PAS domain S-box-containing protein